MQLIRDALAPGGLAYEETLEPAVPDEREAATLGVEQHDVCRVRELRRELRAHGLVRYGYRSGGNTFAKPAIDASRWIEKTSSRSSGPPRWIN